MAYSALINPLIALVAGFAILINPRILSFVIAVYLIVVGVLGLMAVL